MTCCSELTTSIAVEGNAMFATWEKHHKTRKEKICGGQWLHSSKTAHRKGKEKIDPVCECKVPRCTSIMYWKLQATQTPKQRIDTHDVLPHRGTRMLRIKSVWSIQTFAVHKHLQVPGGGWTHFGKNGQKWSVMLTDHFWPFFPKWVQPPPLNLKVFMKCERLYGPHAFYA